MERAEGLVGEVVLEEDEHGLVEGGLAGQAGFGG